MLANLIAHPHYLFPVQFTFRILGLHEKLFFPWSTPLLISLHPEPISVISSNAEGFLYCSSQDLLLHFYFLMFI